MRLNLSNTHPEWHKILQNSLAAMNSDYLQNLSRTSDWLPGKKAIFNAFSLPLSRTKRILFGESPYPRKNSANGYAFYDAAVENIWVQPPNDQYCFKLSKSVNRATSLRNFIKMLIIAEKTQLQPTGYITALPELFENLLSHGFLLLNASLVYRGKEKVQEDAKNWQPFIFSLLSQLYLIKPEIELIFLGKIAQKINPFLKKHFFKFKTLTAEHPYNLSFIHNPVVLNYFRYFALLSARTHSA